jgi:hypothetical protein
MQLEAIDGHLVGGNADRARAVVQQAMQRSRATLPRQAGDRALRASVLEHSDLAQALRREAEGLAVSAASHAGARSTPPRRPSP